MQWLFVSPTNTSEEVLVYGKPTAGLEWKNISTDMNTKSLSMGLEGDARARPGRLSIDDVMHNHGHLTMTTFLMKQTSGGIVICPLRGQENPPDDTNLVIHSDLDGNMLFEFDIVEDVWGYIRHVLSGKVIQPSGGEVDPDNDLNLVLHSSRHPGALFALDDINHYIIQRGTVCPSFRW
ncbi:hypothetical protein ScPMuIL_000078 [Solemya velum]